jgi:hypothetical protein
MLAALLVVVFGAAWLISGTGLIHLSLEAVLAAGLMLLGAAMVVAGRTDWSLSRHAWPVLLGAGLVVALFVTSSTFGVSGALSHVSFGQMSRTATGSTTVYGGFGELTVDATNAVPGATIKVQSIAGETFIKTPPSATLSVTGRVLAGQVCVNGHSYASGLGASTGHISVDPLDHSPPGQPLTIDVHQTAGVIEIGTKGCGHS